MAFLQSPLDHIERGRLFANKEDTLSVGYKSSNDVGDSLTLPGARRPMDDHVGPRTRELDRLELAEVSRQHDMLVLYVEKVV